MQMFTASAALEPTTSARPFPECEVADLAGSGLKFDPTGEFRSHKATLVTVAFQAYGQHQLEPWLKQFVERASPCNILQEGPAVASSPALLNIVYLHGWFFKLFNTMFMNNVAGGLPAGLADYSGVAFSNDEKATDVRLALCSMCCWLITLGALSTRAACLRIPQLCVHAPVRLQVFVDQLKIHNRVMCHLYLVDGNGRIRWR